MEAESAEQYTPENLLSALQESGQIEVTLIKNSHHNFEIHLDFHWNLLIQAQNQGFKVDDLFNNLLSTPEKVLLIMLMHHGKRESWTKLKFVCDLLLFVQKYGNEINWDAFIEKIDPFALKKSLLTGLSIVNLFLPVKDTISLSYPLEKAESLIIKFWEKADFYSLSLKTRINFVRLLFNSHKDFAESWYYLVNYIIYLSYPNPREKRLFTFSKERTFLNLASKIISYFYFYIAAKNSTTYP